MTQKIRKRNQGKGESLFVKLLIAGLTLLTSLTNLVVAVMKLAEGKSGQFVLGLVFFFIFAIFAVIAFSLSKVQLNVQARKKEDYEAVINKISNVTHGLLHRVRDSIYYMENKYESKYFEKVIDFEEFATVQIMQLMDYFAQELSKLAGCPVRTCIKTIDYVPASPEGMDASQLITFARSGLKNIDEMMQEHNNPIKVSENTDFLMIVTNEKNERQRQFFYEKNLSEYDKKLRKNGEQYKNSNSSWMEDYITTIVCPIRLRRKDNQNEKVLVYDLVGFLCADSLDETAFTKETKAVCFDIMKGMADILYVYLDRFIDYYEELKKEIELCKQP